MAATYFLSARAFTLNILYVLHVLLILTLIYAIATASVSNRAIHQHDASPQRIIHSFRGPAREVTSDGPKDCVYLNPQKCHGCIQEAAIAYEIPSPGRTEWNENKKTCDHPTGLTCKKKLSLSRSDSRRMPAIQARYIGPGGDISSRESSPDFQRPTDDILSHMFRREEALSI